VQEFLKIYENDSSKLAFFKKEILKSKLRITIIAIISIMILKFLLLLFDKITKTSLKLNAIKELFSFPLLFLLVVFIIIMIPLLSIFQILNKIVSFLVLLFFLIIIVLWIFFFLYIAAMYLKY